MVLSLWLLVLFSVWCYNGIVAQRSASVNNKESKMKIKRIGTPETVMQNRFGKHKYFAWPTVARLKDGRIAVAASGFRLSHVCPFGKAVMSVSCDDGDRFSEPAVIVDTVLDDRDAGLCPFGESGLLITSVANSPAWQKTIHHAHLSPEENAYADAYYHTLGEAANATQGASFFRISRDNGVTFGPVLSCRITSPHGPLERQDGRILWVGRANKDFGNSPDRIEAHLVDTETGTTACIGAIDDIYDESGKKLISCEPYTVQTPGGRLICHIRTEPNFSTYQSVSDDGGATWSVPRALVGPRGGAASHLLYHSSGVLIAAYTHREQPYGIKLMLSVDNGESWETEHWLYTNSISNDLGYPSTVELTDGSLLTVFYARDEENDAIILKQRWELV